MPRKDISSASEEPSAQSGARAERVRSKSEILLGRFAGATLHNVVAIRLRGGSADLQARPPIRVAQLLSATARHSSTSPPYDPCLTLARLDRRGI